MTSRVKELGLERAIREMYFVKKLTIRQIVNELKPNYNLNYSAVQRFLKEEQLRNYNDQQLERLVRVEEYNALSLVDNLFQAAAQAARELAMVSLVAAEIREEIAGIIHEKGIQGLAQERELLELWNKNTERMAKLSANVPKYIESYNNLLKDTLDVQKNFSFVRLVTEELKSLSPEMHRKIMNALKQDENARALTTSVSAEDVRTYWKQREERVINAISGDDEE